MKLRFTKEALNDFNEGSDYYYNILEVLGQRFSFDFWAKTDLIKANPLHYQERYRNIRIAFLKSFPYGTHFIVDQNDIVILRVLHRRIFFQVKSILKAISL